MNRTLLLFAVMASCAIIPAESQIREFEPPLTLVPVGPQASAKVSALMLGAKPTAAGGYEQSTIEVNGRITTVTLHEMYADSKIFNPANDDPWPGHMDPLHLRTYGGCKEGR